jgi:uncharacterized membrane protein YgaE (UPF0421/DUF939 family)
MEIMTLLTVIGGVMLSIIGWFLRETMKDLRDVKTQSYENKSRIDLLEKEYMLRFDNLTDKFDELKLTMSELIKEIKALNNRMIK